MVIDSEHVLHCNYNCFFSKMNFFQKLHLNTQLQRFQGNGHHIHSINRVICMTQWLQDCINLDCSQHAILTICLSLQKHKIYVKKHQTHCFTAPGSRPVVRNSWTRHCIQNQIRKERSLFYLTTNMHFKESILTLIERVCKRQRVTYILLYGYIPSPCIYTLIGTSLQTSSTDREFLIRYLCIPMDNVIWKKVYRICSRSTNKA